MNDKELNLRAGLAAYSDSDRVVPVNLDKFAPLSSSDDLVKLLIRTGISFSRNGDNEITAEVGNSSVDKTVQNGNELAAAARAACELAASWIDDSDVTA